MSEAAEQLHLVLQECVNRSGALTAMLISREGISLSNAGDTSYFNMIAMSALIAGMSRATQEVAKMVGEGQFSIVLEQGSTRHIHISIPTERTRLVVIFEDYKRIGHVRYAVKKTREDLARILAQEVQGDAALSLSRVKESTLNLIDRIFEAK